MQTVTKTTTTALVDTTGTDRAERFRPMLKTACCGARHYLDLRPTMCLLCGRTITGTEFEKERDLSHLIGTVQTRRHS